MTDELSIAQVALRRLLVVEDDPMHRMIVAAYLRDEAFALEFAESGTAAMHRLAERAYDLAIMDLELADMDGLEVTRRLRELEVETGAARRRTPVIAITAHATGSHVQRALDAGCDGYLVKPTSRCGGVTTSLTGWFT